MYWKDYEDERIEFEKKLKRDFPNLYRGLKVHWSEGGMLDDIHIAPGWYDIIYRLSGKLEALENKPKAIQIKEKFGCLRVYLETDTEETITLVDEAEFESANTCEWSGKKPATQSDYCSWIKTLCDGCHEKRRWVSI